MPIEILNAMARTLWALAWATERDEKGISLGQGDILELAPPTPRGAILHAARIAGQYEERNGCGLASLYGAALRADLGRDIEHGDFATDYAASFGHYLAMMALGHGVSWFDDHARFKLETVGCEGGLAYRAHGRWYYA